MNKKMITILLIILCTLMCVIPSISNAATSTEMVVNKLDRAPRIHLHRTDEKNLIITMTEFSKVSAVKLEKIEGEKSTVLLNKDEKNNEINKEITISKDMSEIKIAKTLLNENDYTKFKLTAYDNSSIKKNKVEVDFMAKNLKEKSKKNLWYITKEAPKLNYSDVFTINAKGSSKIKSLTVKDANNKNAVVNLGNEITGSTNNNKSYKIDLSKLKAKNNNYYLINTVEDESGLVRTEEMIVKTANKEFNTNTKYVINKTNKSPKITYGKTDKDNFIIKVYDGDKISAVKLEKIENGVTTVLLNKDDQNNEKAEGITVSNSLDEIKIAKTLLKEDAFTKFKLTAYDNNNIDINKTLVYFDIKNLKEQDKDKNWYSLYNSPRISYNTKDGLVVTVKDENKVKTLIVKDRNNNNTKVTTKKIADTQVEKKYQIDLTKLNKDKNNRCYLTLTTEDADGFIKSEEIIITIQDEKEKLEAEQKKAEEEAKAKDEEEKDKLNDKSNELSKISSKYNIKGIDKAPKVTYTKTNKDNFIIKLTDGSKISAVKLEKVEGKKTTELLNKDDKNNKTEKGITISDDKTQVKIARTLLKEDAYTKFKLTAYDNNKIDKNKTEINFNVKNLKEQDKNKSWYSIYNAPRLSYSTQTGLVVTVKDENKVKTLTVKDRKNKNATVKTNKISDTKIQKQYKVILTNLKKDKNNRCYLLLTAEDKDGFVVSEEIIIRIEEKEKTTGRASTTPASSGGTSGGSNSGVISSGSNSGGSSGNSGEKSNDSKTFSKGCNHSYGRTYEKATAANPCLVETYQICSKCGRKYILGTKWKHCGQSTKLKTSTRMLGNCKKVVNVYCYYCSRRLGSKTIQMQHQYGEIKTKKGSSSCVTVRYQNCRSCGYEKQLSPIIKHNYKTMFSRSYKRNGRTIREYTKVCTGCGDKKVTYQ